MDVRERVRREQATTVRYAEVLKALGHPVRLCLAHQLATYGPQSVTFFTECMDCSQSGISQHLAKLRAAGVVEATRDGQMMMYRLTDERVRAILALLWSEAKGPKGPSRE